MLSALSAKSLKEHSGQFVSHNAKVAITLSGTALGFLTLRPSWIGRHRSFSLLLAATPAMPMGCATASARGSRPIIAQLPTVPSSRNARSHTLPSVLLSSQRVAHRGQAALLGRPQKRPA